MGRWGGAVRVALLLAAAVLVVCRADDDDDGHGAAGAATGPVQTVVGIGQPSTERILGEILNSYSVNTPGVKIKYSTVVTSAIAKNELANNRADFAVSTTTPSAAELTLAPVRFVLLLHGSAHTLPRSQDIIAWPFMAQGVVPVIRMSGVEQRLVVSAPVIVAMFLGNLSRCDDSRLRALNPGVPLPAAQFNLVVRTDRVGINSVGTPHSFAALLHSSC
jgi:hypothetical protein